MGGATIGFTCTYAEGENLVRISSCLTFKKLAHSIYEERPKTNETESVSLLFEEISQ